MLKAQEQRSEVARMLAEIRAEREAAELALTGVAFGTSKHEFIARKMNRMHEIHMELREIVGDAAIGMIAKELEAYPDRKKDAKDQETDESSLTTE